MSSLEEEGTAIRDENCALPSRLHPQVAHKIQELVSQGIEQVYTVRKQLRYSKIILLHFSLLFVGLKNIFIIIDIFQDMWYQNS